MRRECAGTRVANRDIALPPPCDSRRAAEYSASLETETDMKRLSFLAALVTCLASPAWAQGNIESGKKVFRKCMACHMVGEDAVAKVGPVLNGLFGRQAGTRDDYAGKYSKAMIGAGAGGLVWTEETLTEYLRKPKAMIKGAKMNFVGLGDGDDRADVIAYLRQFSPDYQREE
jgi:cytochrome c